MKSEEQRNRGMYVMSPPAWGAWIEIVFAPANRTDHAVAPRMGGVD